MEMSNLVLGSIGGLFALCFLAVISGRVARSLVYPLCIAACLVLLGQDLSVLFSGGGASVSVLPFGLAGRGMHLRLDALSAFFGVVVNLGGALASLYGIGYGRHDTHHARAYPFIPAFLAGMNLVLVADDVFTFLVAWEAMSLSSWALVVENHRDAMNRKAGYIYLLMASFGALVLMVTFGILVGVSGDFSFDSLRAIQKPASVAGVALVLALIGAGSKAGLVPLHVWLPLAHPAAPSNVSALMSGVMTKVAVYGFIRIAFDLIGQTQPWESLVILALGALTCFIGVLSAVLQEDLKRLLAYSTVENIGIIFIGLGLSLAFKTYGMTAAAALAFTAALLHVFNHSLFKSLLFFGAGAVLTGTGQRDMDRLGGLIHRMPKTAIVFLVGCVSISALPPLNGFVSEWLTFQAILLSPQLPSWALKFLVPGVGGVLALSAALVAACFVKTFGIAFLGRPRSGAAEHAHETDSWSLTAMGILAVLCLLAGILPSFFIGALAPVVQGLIGAQMPVGSGAAWFGIVPTATSNSSYNGILLLLCMGVTGSLTAWFIHSVASRKVRRAPIWDCGFPNNAPSGQYTGSSFSQPLRRVFGAVVFGARDVVDMPKPGETRAASFSVQSFDYIWDLFYAPLIALVNLGSEKLSVVQFFTIRRYLMLVFLTLVSLLVVVALWH